MWITVLYTWNLFNIVYHLYQKKKKTIITWTEGHFITKKLLHQEGKTITNIYVPNNKVPKYLRQQPTKLKGKVYNSGIMSKNFNILLLIVGRTTWQKIGKCTEEPNAINHEQLINICRTCHPATAAPQNIKQTYKGWDHTDCTFQPQQDQTRNQKQR